jgi:hypothetical protein
VDDATAILNTVVGVEVESADPTGQNVSATSRIEGYLTTVDVRSSNRDDGSDASEYCINGNWHREYEYSSLQQIRDVDEPFRSLHCLVMLKNWYVGIQGDWALHWLPIQPTGAKRGQFRRYGRYTLWGNYYNCRTLMT